MNNSVYGKTIENVRKYQDVKLMKMNNKWDEKAFLNKINKPSFKYQSWVLTSFTCIVSDMNI